MDPLATALTILSAMITPAVLISASSSLILTTSQRLSRVIDRTRKIADRFALLAEEATDRTLIGEERAVLFRLLDITTRRSRLLQRALACLYLSLSVFVATSMAIGIVAVAWEQYAWVPIPLGIVGMGLLLYASFLLIGESNMALSAVNVEMDWVLRQGQQYAPSESLEQRHRRGWGRSRH
ncbi:MAG: DUF2721 domain-containing protein [Chloroflexi bacterium]|nr:DUF2721 domain-containing protein [Chloroflexota bacterium]